MYSDVFCRVYNEFGWNYYPEIFGEQLVKWMEAEPFAPKAALDLGCGTGVLCRFLGDRGIRAAGMDLSEGMIAIAREADPQGHYDVADMTRYRPAEPVDLITCTGDALNHIPGLADVGRIFENVFASLRDGGWFLCDILKEGEISDSEPFETDMEDGIHIWFQMTRPTAIQVALTVRVYEQGALAFEEVIRETLHDPGTLCQMLREVGFREVRLQESLLRDGNHGTTWFLLARK
jgi:SAM-dependent methyltransferase